MTAYTSAVAGATVAGAVAALVFGATPAAAHVDHCKHGNVRHGDAYITVFKVAREHPRSDVHQHLVDRVPGPPNRWGVFTKRKGILRFWVQCPEHR